MMAAPSFAGILMLLLSGGGLFSGGGLLGLPPGERDAAFLNCAPAGALVYGEWASRSTGKAGAPGIDGLAADPEVREFLKQFDKAILETIARETANGPRDAQVLGKALPPLIKSLLMRPGCLYVDVDSKAAAKAREEGGPADLVGPILAGLRVTLIVNAGDDADAMAAQIDQLLDLLAEERPLEKTKDLQQQKIPLPLGGAALTLHRHKSYFIVGFGEGTIEAAVAGLSGESQGLASNERFAAAMQKVSIERTGGVKWIDVSGLVSRTSQALGLPGAMIVGVARMTGEDAIDSIAACTGVVDGQIRTRMFINTGGKTEGVLALAAGRAIEPDDFALVPADADLVVAGSLNPSKVLTAVREIVGNADPQSKERLEELLTQLEAELGVSLEEDVIAAFGDVFTIYDSPSAGGLLVTAPVLSLEVRDHAKAERVFAQLMNVLKQALPGERGNPGRRRGVFLKQGTFLDRTIYYVNTVGDDDVPLAPAFCLTDRQLLVAPHPQQLKAHLRFLAANEESFSSRVGGELKIPEGDLLALAYCEPKRLVGQLYGLTPYFGQMILSQLQSDGFPLDIFSLPSARAILPYVGTSLLTKVRTKEGIFVDAQSALPIPGVSAGFLAAPIFGFSSRAVPLGGPREIRIQRARPIAP